MNNILTLTDFSPTSYFGVNSAIQFSKDYNAKLTILNADEKGISISSELNEQAKFPSQIQDKNISAQIDKWIQKARGESSINLRLENQSLKIALKKILTEIEFDLIIMSGTGKGSSKEYWGSTTEMVVSKTHLPVLVLKNELHSTTFSKVIYASSYDVKEKKCFEIMKNLIHFSKDSIIHLLSINTDRYFTQPSTLMMEVMKEYKEMALPISSEIHFYRDYNVNVGIRHFAEKIDPDLIVMSDKIKKPIKHILLGHNALKVASFTNYPILVIDY